MSIGPEITTHILFYLYRRVGCFFGKTAKDTETGGLISRLDRFESFHTAYENEILFLMKSLQGCWDLDPPKTEI